MQKAHLFEAILLVNRGVDEAVRVTDGMATQVRDVIRGLDPGQCG